MSLSLGGLVLVRRGGPPRGGPAGSSASTVGGIAEGSSGGAAGGLAALLAEGIEGIARDIAAVDFTLRAPDSVRRSSPATRGLAEGTAAVLCFLRLALTGGIASGSATGIIRDTVAGGITLRAPDSGLRCSPSIRGFGAGTAAVLCSLRLALTGGLATGIAAGITGGTSDRSVASRRFLRVARGVSMGGASWRAEGFAVDISGPRICADSGEGCIELLVCLSAGAPSFLRLAHGSGGLSVVTTAGLLSSAGWGEVVSCGFASSFSYPLLG
jgi:hypothetical protein